MYIRHELGAGRVKFIVSGTEPPTLVIPLAAGLLSVVVIAALAPRSLAVVALGVGGFVFYWLRNRIKQRAEAQAWFFIASPSELQERGQQAVPRDNIQRVIWQDQNRDVGPNATTLRSDGTLRSTRDEQSSVSVETIDGRTIHLVAHLSSGTAAQVAADLARTLGGVPFSGGLAPKLRNL